MIETLVSSGFSLKPIHCCAPENHLIKSEVPTSRFLFRMISQGMTMEHRSLAIRSPSFWIRNPTSLGLEHLDVAF